MPSDGAGAAAPRPTPAVRIGSMANRIFSRLGLGASLSSSGAFTPGNKAPLAFDDADTHDQRREQITEKDLVWPGKTDSIHVINEEQVAYRYTLTVTDLDTAFYMLLP